MAQAAPFRLALVCLLVCYECIQNVKGQVEKQHFTLEIPRVTIDELAKNSTLRTGLHAYVLSGFAQQWNAINWTLDYLTKKIPFEWVDYYPKNMDDVGSKPFLFKFDRAVQEFQHPREIPSQLPKYMQIRLSLRGWKRLKKDFTPKPLPEVFWDDDEWISKCMQKDSQVDKPAINNFFVTNQWKFLLIGEKGTTMFFHKDGTAASSWQVQLVGKKRWTLCPNTESRYLDPHLDTYNPDYSRFPQFAKAQCGQVTVSPGELLYYPAYWWHHTLQLETPSISYTGALVGVEADRSDLGADRKPHTRFYADLQEKCAKCWRKGVKERQCEDISLRWAGAAPPPLRVVCDEYLPKCLQLWSEHAKALHGGAPKSEL